mmetsp:Transcript_1364/g.147  ORF Transcript_1364/g.147 Transcript_1364/m.147 type:complete len:115 (+) Transcript_1364:397-741(+)
MDHHCLWTATCVGLNNRKAFILVLFYGTSALLCALLFSFPRIPNMFSQCITNLTEFNIFDLIRTGITEILYIGASLNFIGLAYFLIYHIKLLTRNITTLDETNDPSKAHDKKYL